MMKVRMVRISQFGWAGVLGPEDVKKSLMRGCEALRVSMQQSETSETPVGPHRSVRFDR